MAHPREGIRLRHSTLTSSHSFWTRGLHSVTRGGAVLATGLPEALEVRASTSLRGLVISLSGILLLYILLLRFYWERRLPAEAEIWFGSVYTVLFVMLGVSCVFSAVLRFSRLKPAVSLALGQLYQVVLCFCVSYTDIISGPGGSTPGGGFSFAAVLIVLFPLFVPSTLSRTVAVALASAMTGPATLLFHRMATGLPMPAVPDMVDWYLGNFIVVALVVRTAKIINSLSRAESTARRMGSYSLQKKLGHGGMGEVWCASHELLRRRAAIKLIQPDVLGTGGTESLQERFEREAQATAELHSPHSIQLYDFGLAGDGSFYYVMELLDGLSGKDLVKRYGPLRAPRVVHLMRQACDSLWDAHQSGLIHRDVKPANMFICRYGHSTDFVKVLDFGLVKRRSGSEVTLTGDQVITGTPAFMAPEAALGGAIDARTDIYSLGCVAYWLLTGQLVFDREQPMQMAVAHIQNEPPRPSTRTELPIPADLEDVVLKCLAKEPGDRYQTVRELDEALAACGCAGEWTETEAGEWWQTHRPAGVGAPKDSRA